MPRSADTADLVAQIAQLRLQLAARDAMRSEAFESLCMELETLDSQRQWLTETVDWYAELYEFAPIAYLALDGAGLIRDINLTGTVLLGRERQSLLGRPMRLHVVPADRRVFLEHVFRARHESGPTVTELRIMASADRILPVQLISRRAITGGPPVLRTAIFDLSERKRAEQDLLLAHQRLSLALLASEAGFYEYTVPYERLWVSARWSEILGRGSLASEDAALRSWLLERIDPADLPARTHARAAFLAGHSPGHAAEFRVRRADDSVVWIRELAQAAQRGQHGTPTRVVGVFLDISAEKQRLAESERRTAQLRELSAALYRVEENERRELATLLHDDLGQRLVAAQLQLAMIARRTAGPLPDGLANVVQILAGAQDTVRSLSFQLSPPILHDLGLIAALRWLARELGDTLQLDVEIDDDGPLPPLRGNPEFLLFRCVRELLLNVAKHAETPSARVILRTPPDTHYCHISVEDDGVGFLATPLADHFADPAADRPQPRSFGLLSVYERIEGLGGRVLVDSKPGQGTRVLLMIPRD